MIYLLALTAVFVIAGTIIQHRRICLGSILKPRTIDNGKSILFRSMMPNRGFLFRHVFLGLPVSGNPLFAVQRETAFHKRMKNCGRTVEIPAEYHMGHLRLLIATEYPEYFERLVRTTPIMTHINALFDPFNSAYSEPVMSLHGAPGRIWMECVRKARFNQDAHIEQYLPPLEEIAAILARHPPPEAAHSEGRPAPVSAHRIGALSQGFVFGFMPAFVALNLGFLATPDEVIPYILSLAVIAAVPSLGASITWIYLSFAALRETSWPAYLAHDIFVGAFFLFFVALQLFLEMLISSRALLF